MLRLCCRRPRADARVGARLKQIDRRLRAFVMRSAVGWHPSFMGTPPKFGGLQSLGHEAFDGPGVDKHADRLWRKGALRVPLGNMHALHPDAMHQDRPLLSRFRLFKFHSDVACEGKQCLLHKPRDHSGIGPAARHGSRATRVPALCFEDDFAQRVVGASLRPDVAVKVEARPRFRDRIDIERTDLPAELHDGAR